MSKMITLNVYVTAEDDATNEEVLDEVTDALTEAGIMAYIETVYKE